MGVQVDFTKWGLQSLAPGTQVDYWYTWMFDDAHWAEMTALPQSWSPANGIVQKVAQWASKGTLHVTWKNTGTDYVYFTPTVIVAPSR